MLVDVSDGDENGLEDVLGLGRRAALLTTIVVATGVDSCPGVQPMSTRPATRASKVVPIA